MKSNKEVHDLIVNNQKLAYFTVEEVLHKYRQRSQLYDDCVGVAMENLCLAAHSYDPARGSFSHWAILIIRVALWHYLAKEARRGITGVGRHVDLEVLTLDDLLLHEVAARSMGAHPQEIVETRETLQEVQKHLSESDMVIVRLIAAGYDYKTIGDIIYKNPSSAREQMRAMRQKVRQSA